jgi:hypothetical protein
LCSGELLFSNDAAFFFIARALHLQRWPILVHGWRSRSSSVRLFCPAVKLGRSALNKI